MVGLGWVMHRPSTWQGVSLATTLEPGLPHPEDRGLDTRRVKPQQQRQPHTKATAGTTPTKPEHTHEYTSFFRHTHMMAAPLRTSLEHPTPAPCVALHVHIFSHKPT